MSGSSITSHSPGSTTAAGAACCGSPGTSRCGGSWRWRWCCTTGCRGRSLPERPGLADGAHVFRPWSDHPFSTGQLGLPSSEAAVAFAAAAALARLFPEAGLLWYALALGCALTRVASGAHFMSDAVLAAFVGYVVVWMLWRRRRSRS
ncbi:MAG: hypothetical protein DMD60_06555 [Gemmatimonadetes bacterium]|nr:MAG: hypothetical protein DMD60_06555 [Gemmatimonadota bacterium]